VRILLTGGSSFTGYWFARELAAAGNHVVAPLPRGKQEYLDIRGERVARLADVADIVWSAPFGTQKFIDLLANPFDLLCHHAARVTGYRSPDFDIAAALAENTKNLAPVLRTLSDKGLRGVVLTGSVFEAGEGAGDLPLRAFSPYGVAKGITCEVVSYWCAVLKLPLGKFVIPNPFGPFEEPRFCHYLIDTWSKHELAEIRTPRYVRDNIHVDLLAKAYRAFADRTVNGSLFTRTNPSGYVESQGEFAQRFAREMGTRLGLEARIKLSEQTDFSEPMMRVNTEPLDGNSLDWSERKAWDGLAEFYRSQVHA
jgi:nucleoside-diphosphate-sugar epimerase